MLQIMTAAVLGVAVVGPGAAAQDPGRPFVPGQPQQLARAYVQNNTWRPVRFVVSSANGTTSGVLAAGFFGEFSFVHDGKPRVLATFDIRGGAIVGVREIEVNPNHVYLAGGPAFPVGPAAAPPMGGGPRAAPTPAKDKGQPVQPGQLKNVTKVK